MRVFSVGPAGVQRLPVEADGSVLLDRETGTRAWYGEAARKELAARDRFECDTAVVLPDEGSLTVSVGDREMSLHEAGALRIPAGAECQVKKVEGDALLLRSERAPGWYEQHGPRGRIFDDLVRHTIPYPHSGWDASGLVWESGTVVAYARAGKRNAWTGSASEWILNSTSWPGQGHALMVGVSHVQTRNEGVVPFGEVRPAESLHRHPERDGRRQVEAYLVTDGRAAMAVEHDGTIDYLLAQPGDLLLIEPGVAHCVAAVEGPYEHLAVQVPSTFQYGYLFKEEVGGDTHALMRGGVEALNSGAGDAEDPPR